LICGPHALLGAQRERGFDLADDPHEIARRVIDGLEALGAGRLVGGEPFDVEVFRRDERDQPTPPNGLDRLKGREAGVVGSGHRGAAGYFRFLGDAGERAGGLLYPVRESRDPSIDPVGFFLRAALAPAHHADLRGTAARIDADQGPATITLAAVLAALLQPRA